MDYGKRYQVWLHVEDKMKDAEQAFKDYAEKYGIMSALRWEADNVRRAHAFDYYTKNAEATLHQFVREEKTQTNALDAVRIALQDAKEDAYSARPVAGDDDSQAAREGRYDAIKALRRAERDLKVGKHK